VVLSVSCDAGNSVKPGNDVLVERHLSLLEGKRIGVITNHTGRLSDGRYLVDVLLEKRITIVALFGPEHGIRGEAAAGEKLDDTKDEKTGIPVFSLYGPTRKPTPAMLENVDVLVYDIQDVGARFYTYISTMGLAMEAAAERGIPFIVADRPNPLGGDLIDGPVMEDSLTSFVGMYRLPVVYGLTCGELANMINGEGWLGNGKTCQLTVIRMEGWSRAMRWEATGLTWIPPSPNIPTPAVALVYPATCIIEATNISEGRGTENPFATIGAPFINAAVLADAMSRLGLQGVQFHPATFTPGTSKFKGIPCSGITLEVTDPLRYRPSYTALSLLHQTRSLYPDKFTLSRSSFLRLMGSEQVYNGFIRQDSPGKIEEGWSENLRKYRARSAPYRLYQAD
jgi:uncharacterized protein YbbC (DUF1343 family)